MIREEEKIKKELDEDITIKETYDEKEEGKSSRAGVKKDVKSRR